jgi:hypothetical protein
MRGQLSQEFDRHLHSFIRRSRSRAPHPAAQYDLEPSGPGSEGEIILGSSSRAFVNVAVRILNLHRFELI